MSAVAGRRGAGGGVRTGLRGGGMEGEASVKELEPDSVRFLSVKGPNCIIKNNKKVGKIMSSCKFE